MTTYQTYIDFLGNTIISSACRVNLLKLRIFRWEQTRLDEAHVIPTMRGSHSGLAPLGAAFDGDALEGTEIPNQMSLLRS